MNIVDPSENKAAIQEQLLELESGLLSVDRETQSYSEAMSKVNILGPRKNKAVIQAQLVQLESGLLSEDRNTVLSEAIYTQSCSEPVQLSSGPMSVPFEEPEFKIVKKERRHYMQYHEPREDIHQEVVKDDRDQRAVEFLRILQLQEGPSNTGANDKPSVTDSPSQSGKKGKIRRKSAIGTKPWSTKSYKMFRERQRREEIYSDPVKYEAYLAKSRENQRRYREKLKGRPKPPKTAKEIERRREATRKRVRKYRLKKKALAMLEKAKKNVA